MLNAIRVKTREPYDVLIGEGILPTLGERVMELSGKRYRKVMVVCDLRVRSLHGRAACEALAGTGLEVGVFDFPQGEKYKNLSTLEDLLDQCTGFGLTRTDLVVALGGGVTGDLAGFAAAVYQRGIDYIQVPTTLLAAVDASVGGKTAVNLVAGKNLAGAFWQPQLVLCDTALLHTLDDDHFADGLAEAVKHGCIRDPALFALLEQGEPRRQAAEIIARSVALKSEIVSADERERDQRLLLNFGHTLGHGIERLSTYKTPHGHAVAVGMCLVADACARHGLLDSAEAARIRALLERLGLPTQAPFPPAEICKASSGDKKRQGDILRLVTLERIGKAAIYPLAADQLTDFFLN